MYNINMDDISDDECASVYAVQIQYALLYNIYIEQNTLTSFK